MRTATIKDNIIYVKFFHTEQSEFTSDLAKIKTLQGRKWNSINKIWEVPFLSRSIEQLREWQFEIIGEFIETPKIDYSKIKIDIDMSNLFEYQRNGVKFFKYSNGRGLLADDAGLGKTAQVVTYYKLNLNEKLLVVCPASLKHNWRNELNKFANIHPNKIHIISGKKEYKYPDVNIFIINYDILANHIESLQSQKIDFVVFDESHYLSNTKSIRYKSVKKVASKIKKVIAISGTPIENKPMDIFGTLNLLFPKLFDNRYRFGEKYCGMSYGPFGVTFNGATNMKELHNILSDGLMLRRTKDEVLKDLPSKIVSSLPFEPDKKAYIDYCKIRDTDIDIKDGKDIVGFLAKMEALKQATWQCKKDSVFEWIDTFLDNNPTLKLVIFGIHKLVISDIMNRYPDISVKIDGSISSDNRNDTVYKFQNDKNCKIFVGNIKAAGVGLTLTAASHCLFVEYGWTYSSFSQATDRLHRIGQKDCVNIYCSVAEGTVDEDLISLIDSKRSIVSQIIDGVEIKDDDLLSILYKRYKLSKNKSL